MHIGGAQEKHWQKGLDYSIKDGKVYFIDQNTLIKRFSVDKYANALARGKLNELLPDDLSTVSLRAAPFSGDTREIKQHVKNLGTGKPIIPGSSLKGAIRSVIFSYLVSRNPDLRHNTNYIENNVFGKIQQDFMRFVQVGDIEFTHCTYLNTKIFNLISEGNQLESAWKNGQNQSRFSADRFTTGYECIDTNQFASVSVAFDLEGYKQALERGIIKPPQGASSLFNENFAQNLWQIIQTYGKSYFDKELAFFEKYANQQNNAAFSYDVFEGIKQFEDIIHSNEGVCLRIAAGSGFHSITGDWQHEDHLVDEVRQMGRRTRGFRNKKVSAKSRKLGFVANGEAYEFYPMGYVQFVDNEYYESNWAPKIQEKQEQVKLQKQEAKALKKKKEEEAQRAAEEALKPKTIHPKTIQKSAGWVDVEVLDCKYGTLELKPFIDGFEQKVYTVKFPRSVEIGSIMRLKMQVIAKGKKLQHQGRPIQKRAK